MKYMIFLVMLVLASVSISAQDGPSIDLIKNLNFSQSNQETEASYSAYAKWSKGELSVHLFKQESLLGAPIVDRVIKINKEGDVVIEFGRNHLNPTTSRRYEALHMSVKQDEKGRRLTAILRLGDPRAFAYRVTLENRAGELYCFAKHLFTYCKNNFDTLSEGLAPFELEAGAKSVLNSGMQEYMVAFPAKKEKAKKEKSK